ncbi:Methyltransferase domain protein [Anatilimnocola aggregata]|uniref:Methyltransferase domain protein n=1 Tax=Anatilimnocola aggregata TaxID=2528021 RepID=A0A517YL27_9BACT|nr:class I SAM-dependent methyltransferase [Anatilimnocola aggregata]QDU30910.1 Methyltransferase domain protein [Anatilimnocola aggregata]
MPNHPSLPLDPAATAARVGAYWREQLPRAIHTGRDISLVLDRGLAELSLTNLWGSENREPSFLMWQQAGEILQPGWLQLRAREKPRGYAGDHEMLGAIFQERVTDNPLGQAFDRYFLRQAAPHAVRNRMYLVRDLIFDLLLTADLPKKVVVVGSGSALEVAAALQQLSAAQKDRGEIVLLDLDPTAILLAEQNLRPHLGNIQLVAESENLVRLPRKTAKVSRLSGADLVICTGFFDYLEDDAATEMLRMIWNCLRPGGQALVFNFAPWNPTRAYMEWIGNWYLLYRNRADLARIASEAEIPANNFEISAEASGIDLLLTLRKS